MRWFYYVLLGSFIFSALLTFGIDHPTIEADAREYDELGWNLANGRGFTRRVDGLRQRNRESPDTDDTDDLPE